MDVRYLSVLFQGDDAFDADEGYQGRGQFLFAMLGADGNHGTEMDSRTNGNLNSLPRSHPAFYSMTIIGSGDDGRRSALMRLREGTGGKFGNVILTNLGGVHAGVRNGQCGSEIRTQVFPNGDVSNSHLYFSSNNIIYSASSQFVYDSGCSNANFVAVDADPLISGGFTESSRVPVEPRPACGSAAWTAVDTIPDSWFGDVDYKGAFGHENWLDGWSILSLPSQAGFVADQARSAQCPAAGDARSLCGDITSDLSLQPGAIYVLSCQTFVRPGATLSIAPGVTIYATPRDSNGLAPALVVDRGATIVADGTAEAPITFTAINPEVSSTQAVETDTAATTTSTVLETRGKWGGLIILGNAPTSSSSPPEIEGISGHTYGGTDPFDSSGILRYVRVWHGGASIGADNEINGITFGGVGRGTVVEHCEVAFNLDDVHR